MTAEVTRREFLGAAGSVAAGAAAGAALVAPSVEANEPAHDKPRKILAFVAAHAKARPRPPPCASASMRPRPSTLESRSS